MIKFLHKVSVGIDIFFLMIVIYNIYAYLPYRLEYIGHIDKIHSHRVNTITKLKQANRYYSGIELDVYYDDENNVYDIFHPPVESIGLTLDVYFSNIKNKELKIWLDFKNLTERNSEDAIDRLEYLINKYNLNKNVFLIESKNIKALQSVNKRHFLTSYYVPSHLYESSSLYKDSIYGVIKHNSDQHISFSHQNYEDLQRAFPLRTKYVWTLYGKPISRSRFKQVSITREILRDTTVKRMLVPFKSIGGNR